MRDEAHRFGITHHRQRRSKTQVTSSLTEIKGIGEKTFELLIKKYRSVKKLKEVPLEELSEVIGPAKAKIVLEALNNTTTDSDTETPADNIPPVQDTGTENKP